MKKIFSITSFSLLIFLGLGACNKTEEEIAPLKTTANNGLQNDFFYTLPSQSVRLNVLDNDNVPAGGTLTFGKPHFGTITSDPAGFIFNAPSAAGGVIGFSYKYCINNSCDSAAVNIFIGGNCFSTLVPDYATTPVNQAVDIPVLANDILCLPGNASLLTGNGNAVFLPGNILRYTPNNNFSGIDTLSYDINNGEYKRAKVWIQVGATSCNLLANDDFITVFQVPGWAYPRPIDPLKNDWNCKSVALEIISAPAHGSVVKDPQNPYFLYYMPHLGYLGADSFQYRICTPTGDCSVATINLNVTN